MTTEGRFESTLVSIWQQVLVDEASEVSVESESYPVQRTRRAKLREVEVVIAGRKLRAVEQNPNTPSRWAKLAREGKKVMQFMEGRRYVAVVVSGKITLYQGERSSPSA